jgi:glycerophosphoryl diester phosphodiesterase
MPETTGCDRLTAVEPSRRPAVIAHRGASRAARENTLGAFRLARALGADAVELDVRRTLDGALAVHHDAHLPDGRAVRDVLAGELPDHVPLLAAALDACDGMWVNVEIKNDPSEPAFDPNRRLADEVAALAAERGDEPRILVSSFDLATVDRLRSASGGRIRTALLVVQADGEVVRTAADHGHDALHPGYVTLTEAVVAGAREAGLDVNPWTCDDPEWMGRLAVWGVTGICTNVPDVALATLGPA